MTNASLSSTNTSLSSSTIHLHAQGTRVSLETFDIIEKIARYTRALTTRDVARILGVSSRTIFRLVARNVIPHYKIGTCIRFNPARLAAWLTEQRGNGQVTIDCQVADGQVAVDAHGAA